MVGRLSFIKLKIPSFSFHARASKSAHPVKMLAFSLMPNHFYFVIEASHHQSLSRFMQWLLASHVRVEERSLVPLGDARLGRIGLDEWLRRSQART